MALVKWTDRLHPFVDDLQKLALQPREVFVPQDEVQDVVRGTTPSLVSSQLFTRLDSLLRLDPKNTAGAHALRDFDIVTRSRAL